MRNTFHLKTLAVAIAAFSVASVTNAAGLDRSGQDVTTFLKMAPMLKLFTPISMLMLVVMIAPITFLRIIPMSEVIRLAISLSIMTSFVMV